MEEMPPVIVRPPAARPLRERVLTAFLLGVRALTTRMQRAAALPADPCRILVIKPCCLGDVLLTTPALAALRIGYPQSTIHYAVGRYAAPAIDHHPDVGRVLVYAAGGGRGWRSLLAIWRLMRAGRYDVCLVLERSPLFATLPLLAGIPVRAGIDSAGRGFALNLRVPWDESLHEADLYLSVAGALGCPTGGHRLRFVPGSAAETQVEALWLLHGLPIGSDLGAPVQDAPRAQRAHPSAAAGTHDPRRPVIAIAPGGGTNPGMDLPEKRWPAERFAALAGRLRAELDATIVLLGGPADRALCAAVAALIDGPSLDLSGDTPLAGRGALLRRCTLYVGNDSGPTHLAVAVGCPTVAVFGPTSVALYGPYHATARAVHRDLPCSPCFVHGHFPPCPNRHACMCGLPVDAVLDACRAVLAEARTAGTHHVPALVGE